MNHLTAVLFRFCFLYVSFFLFLFLEQATSQSCDNWLSLPSQGSKVTIGDVDITGNKLTVEAMFNRNPPLNNGIYYGHLISKHTDQTNVNYALLPNGCEITTTASGYKAIFQTCLPELGKTYHVAMVYDGVTLKFFRNGFLMSQVACTGNLVNNNLLTTIGQLAGGTDPAINQFLGFTNEVRIWNVARTESQLRTYMSQVLPAPGTQPGLVAYYNFNNEQNKQGNIAFNGLKNGGAISGAINPACSFVPSSCNNVNEVSAAFIIPDTVCVNTPVNISNISINASSHYWNFCVGDPNSVPIATNLGNPGGRLSLPVFTDIVTENGNYYVFVSNNWPGGLVRLDFGTSLLNTPTVVNLGTVNGVIPNTIEGIQIVKDNGRWYAIMVGGDIGNGNIPSRIIKIDFGPSITNTTPVGTNWGNIGNLAYPVDLHVFNENGIWYGFTVNAQNNTITRFNFTNSFNAIPTGVNLGNLGGLNYPTGIYAIKDKGNWHLFITNDVPNASLTRIDFGTLLSNPPSAAINLGNPGNVLNKTRDIYILKDCDKITAFAVNASSANDLVKLDFNNDLLSVPTGVSLGDNGNLSFPHSISKLFRVGNDMYTFVTNVNNNTITRFQFKGCTSSNLVNSSLSSPPPIIYNSPDIYNINLTIDEGLPTQSSLCKQVVVLPELEHQPTQQISICNGQMARLGSSSITGTYLWSNGAKTDSISVSASGVYWVETKRFGCTNRDSFNVTFNNSFVVNLGTDKTICAGENIILDAGANGESYLWNTGSTDQMISVSATGTYFVFVTRNSCTVSDTIIINQTSKESFDFNYRQDICDPFVLQFFGLGKLSANSIWKFGDGSSITGNTNPQHRYTAEGNFLVSFVNGNGTCNDTIAKMISVTILKEDVILTPDSTICYGTGKQLRTVPSLSFCWNPITFLDDPYSPNPVSSPTRDITYYFTAEVTGSNLITNGDFSMGNTGFTSQYIFANPNVTEGQYFIGKNPQAWNQGLHTCGDHSTGNGNMMMVNGAPVADVNVWTQTVNVVPNTNYSFSTWIQSLWPPNPSQLQFSINGKAAGLLITAGSNTCEWNQFYTTWNSGDNTTAEISIVNKNTAVQGNDFALDDISFAPVFIKRDSVQIKVETPKVNAGKDTIVCSGKPVQMNASGAQTYSWSPAMGLSDALISNPTATTLSTANYVVTGTSVNGCNAKDTVRVMIYSKPSIVVSKDTIICNQGAAYLTASGGSAYKWTPTATLNNATISNPMAKPVINTRYYVSVVDGNNCEYLDSTLVSIRPPAVFTISDNKQICKFDSLQLNAAGGDKYVWQVAEGINNTAIANPMVTPLVSTNYNVVITETLCNESRTLSTQVTVMPLPVVRAGKSNDIDCSNDRSLLNANGAEKFIWTPAATLSNASIANPIATPVSATQYVVQGTDLAGCRGYDTITVKVDNINKGNNLLPNAFTPNNDGLNDCFGVKYWGSIKDFEFSIYNRWGERIFFTKNAGKCWDGTYKGVKQDGGVYVYMIRATTLCDPEVFRKGTFVLIR